VPFFYGSAAADLDRLAALDRDDPAER
jgi:hypothetical protein